MTRWLDPVLGVLLAGLGLAIVFGGDDLRGPEWANVLAFIVYGGLVAARSRAVMPAAFGFVALVAILGAALTPPPEVITVSFGLPLFSYAAGGHRRRRLRRLYLPALLGAIAVANLGVDGSTAGDWIFPMSLSIAAYVIGRNNVYRDALAAEHHEAAVRAEELQGEEAARAVAAERRRIAREMHDVVAHSISVMVVQAGGARRVLERDPARAEQAAAHIERTGRETLTEMRRLLGVMHGGLEPAELEPNPTLDQLDALCVRAGARLRVDGEPRPIPAGLAIAAYRVVQEALTDSTRTVPGSEPSVSVEWSADHLELCVCDDRPYAGPELPGVRERVALYDGKVRTGPRGEGGGHRLVVTFPLHDAIEAVNPARSLTQ